MEATAPEEYFETVKNSEPFIEFFEFDGFKVELRKHYLAFWIKDEKGNEKGIGLPFNWFNSLGDDINGITICHRDRWGSQMIFVHYPPTSKESLFRFIARAYKVQLPEE